MKKRITLGKLHMVDGDDIVQSMARISGVYHKMMNAKKESKLTCGSVTQRVMAGKPSVMISDFHYFFGFNAASENGWIVLWGEVKDFGSEKELVRVLDLGREMYKESLKSEYN